MTTKRKPNTDGHQLTEPPKRIEKLPSGKTVEYAPLVTGRHIRQARRMQAEAGTDFIYAIIAQVVKVNGENIVPEDLDDFCAADVVKMTEDVQGKMV